MGRNHRLCFEQYSIFYRFLVAVLKVKIESVDLLGRDLDYSPMDKEIVQTVGKK